MNCKYAWRGLVLLGSMLLLGCDQPAMPPQPAVQAKVSPAPQKSLPKEALEIPRPPTLDDNVDEADCFTHQYTNVAFCFPRNWKHGRPDLQGVIANLDLDQQDVSALVRFGRTFADKDTEAAMLAQDLAELREMYGKRAADPEAVRVGEKVGHRIRIAGPLWLHPNKNLDQVNYLFYVDSVKLPADQKVLEGKYTVSVSITAEKEKLDRGDELLHCLRWQQ
jgi:hypothetical protein